MVQFKLEILVFQEKYLKSSNLLMKFKIKNSKLNFQETLPQDITGRHKLCMEVDIMVNKLIFGH